MATFKKGPPILSSPRSVLILIFILLAYPRLIGGQQPTTPAIYDVLAILPMTSSTVHQQSTYTAAMLLAQSDANHLIAKTYAPHTPPFQLNFSIVDSALGVDNPLFQFCNALATSRNGVVFLVGPGTTIHAKYNMEYLWSDPDRVLPALSLSSVGSTFHLSPARTWRMRPSELVEATALAYSILHFKRARDRLNSVTGAMNSSERIKEERVAVVYDGSSYSEQMLLAFTKAAGIVTGSDGTRVTLTGAVYFSADAPDSKYTSNMFESLRVWNAKIIVAFLQANPTAIGRLIQGAILNEYTGQEYQWIWGGEACSSSLVDEISEWDSTFTSPMMSSIRKEMLGSLCIKSCEKEKVSDEFQAKWNAAGGTLDEDGSLPPDALYIHDAAMLAARAVIASEQSLGSSFEAYNVSGCFSGKSWPAGAVIMDNLNKLNDSISFADSYENITFSTPSRSEKEVSFCVYNWGHDDFYSKLYQWHEDHREKLHRVSNKIDHIFPGGSDTYPLDRVGTRGRALRGVVRDVPPFVIVDYSRSGNERFSGISIDMISNVSKYLNFTYVLEVVDADFHAIAELLANDRFDFAIDWMTSTAARLDYVQFSTSYYDLGLVFVTRTVPEEKYTTPQPSFSFLSPFSLSLWMCILGFTLGVSLIFCAFEYKYSKDIGSSYLSASYFKSLYANVALLMQQLVHKPETLEGYIVTVGFLFFCLIVTASYTAQLTSFLVYARNKDVFQGIEDFKKRRGVLINEVAILVNTSIESFVQRSILGCYPSCSEETRAYQLCNSIPECFAMVVNGSVKASIIDSPIAEDYELKHCGLLASRGELFNLQYYGIAFPRHSTLVHDFDMAILLAREDGVVRRSRQVYLPESTCDEDVQETSMTFWEMSGLFLVVGVLFGLAIIFVLGRLFGMKTNFHRKYRESWIGKKDYLGSQPLKHKEKLTDTEKEELREMFRSSTADWDFGPTNVNLGSSLSDSDFRTLNSDKDAGIASPGNRPGAPTAIPNSSGSPGDVLGFSSEPFDSTNDLPQHTATDSSNLNGISHGYRNVRL